MNTSKTVSGNLGLLEEDRPPSRTSERRLSRDAAFSLEISWKKISFFFISFVFYSRLLPTLLTNDGNTLSSGNTQEE